MIKHLAGMAWAWLVAAATLAQAQEMQQVSFRHEGKTLVVKGQVLVEDRQGGVLLLGRDGRLWTISAPAILRRQPTGEPFAPFSPQELGKRLLAELGPDFELHITRHYVICYNTGRGYAHWVGALFERLYLAFRTFWKRKGLRLQEPQFPLVAVVFADKSSFRRHARPALGDAVENVLGYYNQRSNRMVMYDLTGAGPQQRRFLTQSQIRALLSRPGAERTVATIIHEATHQIAFNTGLQRRFADIPVWVSEGLAMFFEVPDLKSKRGWRGLGKVNRVRLRGFLAYLPHRPQDSLLQLLKSDQRFRDPQQVHHAYDEAWAWYYFLMRTRPKQLVQYHKLLAQKPVLQWDTPQQRLEDFTSVFGPLPPLEKEFFRFLKSQR